MAPLPEAFLRGFRAFLFQSEMDSLWTAFEAADDALELAEKKASSRIDEYMKSAGADDGVEALIDQEQRTTIAARHYLRTTFAVSFYHIWEQHSGKWARLPKFDHDKAVAHLETLGATVNKLRLEEARLIANTLKHGEGASSTKLFQMRSDLFPPLFPGRQPRLDRLQLSRIALRELWEQLYSAVPVLPARP